MADSRRPLPPSPRTVVLKASLLLLVVWLLLALPAREVVKFATIKSVGPLSLVLRPLAALARGVQTPNVVTLPIYPTQLWPPHAVKSLVELFPHFSA